MILLPWGDFEGIKMSGTLKSTGLLANPPKCYVVDSETREILGWAPGYEDGGQLVAKREFPVMYYDGRNSVGWLRAQNMTVFNFYDLDLEKIPHFDLARDEYVGRLGKRMQTVKE